MKIRFKGGFSPATVILAFPAFLLVPYLAFPEMLFQRGLSYGIRWQLPFSSTGRILRETVVRSTRDLDGKLFYAREGDRVILSRSVDLEEGAMYTSFWRKRSLFSIDMLWQEMVYESTSDSVTIDIQESGFYYFHFRLHKFKGSLEVSWEKNPN